MSRDGDELPLILASRLRGVLRVELEDELAATAVEQGLVSAQELDDARARDEHAPSALAALKARGRLHESDVAELARATARRAFSRPAAPGLSAVPPEVEAVASDPAANLAQFVLLETIRQGGAGEVWKAWDRRLARFVAVKISTASRSSAVARERFEREMHAAARLTHANIVPVFESDVDKRGRPYLVMPYIAGQTLEDARLDVRESVRVMRDAARAIEYAHASGVVHRDVKPGNLMIDASRSLFVLDFGLAFLRENEADTTRPGDILGTAAYMSPEQARGSSHEAHPTMDIYGLGATLYRLCTGGAPFGPHADGTGGSMAEIIARVASHAPERARARNPKLDHDLDAIIAKAMARDPDDRYATAAALADDLSAWLDGAPVIARRRSPMARAAHALGRRPPWIVAAAAVVLCGALAVRLVQESHRQSAALDVAESAAEALLRARAVTPEVRAAYERARRAGAASANLQQLLD